MPDVEEVTREVTAAGSFLERVTSEVEQVIIGQRRFLERLYVGLLADGHVLVEGVPGLAKSLLVQTLARALGLHFQRIQFTPDLLPADVLGTLVYRPDSGKFVVRKGPIFAQLVLADELNRAPPKVQSALLEAMQERQVTIGDETHPLPRPFLVMATQNPIEQEGTYALPEAEVDRFLLKVTLGYPDAADEREILRRHGSTRPPRDVSAVATATEILAARDVVDRVFVDDKITDYIVRIAAATRDPAAAGLAAVAPLLRYGASPRASLSLLLAARAHAFLQGRGYVLPGDVKALAVEALGHRLVLSYEAEARGLSAPGIVQQILGGVDVP